MTDPDLRAALQSVATTYPRWMDRAEPQPVWEILYAPRDEWLVLLARGWRLPWVVTADRSGHAVLMERPA